MTHKVAVLDDYQGISHPHYSTLDTSQFQITHLKDTLLPFNHPDTPQSVKNDLVTRLQPFDVIATMRERTPFPKALIDQLPQLKLLLTTGLRNRGLDLPAFAARNIPVVGTVDKTRAAGGTDSTTQHTIALILSLARNIPGDTATLTDGSGSATWQTTTATGLAGKTLGIVGLGRLGAATAKIMYHAFGMRIIAWSTNLTQEAADAKAAELAIPNITVVSKEDLFRTADIVSLHTILSDRSRGLVSASELSLMKPSSFLINTSRGPLVVEKDLIDTLKAGKIRGAAVDVFDIEPLPADSEWRRTDWGKNGKSRVVLTPHMGYVEEDTLSEMYAQQVENLQRWVSGQDLVNVLS